MNKTNSTKQSVAATSWRKYINSILAAEISTISQFTDRTIQWRPRTDDKGMLLDFIAAPNKSVANEEAELACELDKSNGHAVILLNGNVNHDLDIHQTLSELKKNLKRHTRIVLLAYNPYLRWLYDLADTFKIRQSEKPTTFVTRTDLSAICKLAGYEIVRLRNSAYCPWQLFGIGNYLNKILPAIPLLRWLSLTTIVVLRPIIPEASRPALSIVIPARNERGNIENALKRLPEMPGTKLEIIFVEGHSKDNTWEEIQRVIPLYQHKFAIQAFQQTGKGKSDAVRLGFSKATGELLTILDADLTMPPELLTRFYDAYCFGHADFINGSRLTYPMGGAAMRFLNRLGNVFFAKSVSVVLETRLSDTLCGTKLLTRNDYVRMTNWRNHFGDFDPFGDFELLFPAAILALGMIDIPIRYRDRTYGSTNIRRFRDGLLLLRMTVIGFLRVRLGKI